MDDNEIASSKIPGYNRNVDFINCFITDSAKEITVMIKSSKSSSQKAK